MVHCWKGFLEHHLLTWWEHLLVVLEIKLWLDFGWPHSITGSDWLSCWPLILSKILTAIWGLRSCVEETGNSKAEKYFDKLSGGGFDLSFLFVVELFDSSFQLFVHFLNLFDVLLFPISAFLCWHSVPFLFFGLLWLIFETKRWKHVIFNFNIFQEFFRSLWGGIPLFGVLSFEL